MGMDSTSPPKRAPAAPSVLSEHASTVDFSQYRSLLKNQSIVDDLEKQFNGFQVKKYDVNRQIKAIEAFESQAVKGAEETKGKVDAELQDLEKTLKNIESARPFEDLTVVRTWRMMLHKRDSIADVFLYRTRLSPPVLTLTTVSSSSWPRAAGRCRATRRYVLPGLLTF